MKDIFIDYQKAFDNIRYDLLIPISQETNWWKGHPDNLWTILDQQSFKLNHASQASNIRIAKGIRQECIPSLFLFNMGKHIPANIWKHLNKN
jgi:hypothetical protein